MLKLNYGINRRVGRRIVHENHRLCVKGDPADGTVHAKVIAAVRRRHPGWLLTGYAVRPEPRRRHVVMCQPGFVAPIEAGTKLHTIRPHRVREIRAGDVLDLRAWSGAPYRTKQVMIREVMCVGVAQIEVDARRQRIFLFNPSHHYPQGGYVIDEIAFAQRDGFTYTADLFAWFLKHHGPVFTGQLIEWSA